jgi:hypothetical protein
VIKSAMELSRPSLVIALDNPAHVISLETTEQQSDTALVRNESRSVDYITVCSLTPIKNLKNVSAIHIIIIFWTLSRASPKAIPKIIS